jgi:hypothetical protein
MMDRKWQNPSFSPQGSTYSFDSVPAALLALFEVANLEIWADIMFSAVDVVGQGRGSVRNANPGAAVYFVSFLFVVCFFVQEIFVAVIVDHFKRLKTVLNGSAFMTEEQKEWVRLQKTIKKRHPRIHPPPSQDRAPIRARFYALVKSSFFEPFVTAVVIVNVLLMLAVPSSFPSSISLNFHQHVDTIFTYIYGSEILLRIYAVGPYAYFLPALSSPVPLSIYFLPPSRAWNLYDCGIAVWGILYLALGEVERECASCLLLLRLGRTLRIFRLVRHSEHLRRLCRTLYLALPSLKNIGECCVILQC